MSEPVCTAEPIDLGPLLLEAEIRKLDGVISGLYFEHECNGVRSPAYIPLDPEAPEPRWTVTNPEPLSLSPSILCRACGLHGFVTAGRWVPV